MFVYIFLGIIGCISTVVVGVIDFGTCSATPYNDAGLCLRLEDCKFIYDIVKSDNISDQDRENLSKIQCGFDNTQNIMTRRVLVCCPNKYRDNVKIGADDMSMKAGNILPDAGQCGSSFTDRVINGDICNIDEFPWMALIKYKNVNHSMAFLCGGSLINSRYILTAAHCVNKPRDSEMWEIDSVRLGEWNRETNPDCTVDVRGVKECAPPYVEVGVERIITHANYIPKSPNQLYDIALLRLSESVAYNKFLKPICLPLAEEIRNQSFHDTAMNIAGWGSTENAAFSALKLKAVIKISDIADCKEKYEIQHRSINPSHHLCAIGDKQHDNTRTDSCRGDSGGPLMVMERCGGNDIYYAIGVVSFGPRPCGITDWPGVYARVSQYIDWIKNNLEP